MLNPQEIEIAKSFNRRARQLLWRSTLPDSSPLFGLDDNALIDWVLDFQHNHGLKMDARLGPSTLLTILAQDYGGLGGIIVGGKEIPIPDTQVARLFKPATPLQNPVCPDLSCILSVPELLYACRDRIKGRRPIRTHFSIDSSTGTQDHSLILQWADPLDAVTFCPTQDHGDYPKGRQCIGIEIETVLLNHQLDADERQWMHRRSMVRGNIGAQSVFQPAIYPHQIRSLKQLLLVLESATGIPCIFPTQEGLFVTSPLPESELSSYRGCLARFHYCENNHEPGVGFVCALPDVFSIPTDASSSTKPSPTISDSDQPKSSQSLKPSDLTSISSSSSLKSKELNQNSGTSSLQTSISSQNLESLSPRVTESLPVQNDSETSHLPSEPDNGSQRVSAKQNLSNKINTERNELENLSITVSPVSPQIQDIPRFSFSRATAFGHGSGLNPRVNRWIKRIKNFSQK